MLSIFFAIACRIVEKLIIFRMLCYAMILEPPQSQKNCISTNKWGCRNKDCCNPSAECGSNGVCLLPCQVPSVPTGSPTMAPTFGSCLCNYSTVGCQKNSDCCDGLKCNVYQYYSQCEGNTYLCILNPLNPVIVHLSYPHNVDRTSSIPD